MAAGLGFKDFQTGEVLTAADVDGYLMQGVWVFADATARDAAVTSPQEGNFAYLKDTNVTTYYTGSAWANLDTTGMTNPMTTTGDTIYSSSGSTPARLAIGSTGQVLTVAGGVPSWATPASGLTLISETAASSLTSLSFTSISGSYKQLLLIWSGIRHDSTGNEFAIRLNNSSSSVYNSSGFYASWPGSYSLEGFSRTSLSLTDIMPFGKNTNLANVATDVAGILLIDNYASSTKTKTWSLKFNYYDYANDTYRAYDRVGFFNDTTAITSIDIVRLAGSGNFSNQNNTTIRLYGVS